MLSKTYSATLLAADAKVVEVEVSSIQGDASMTIVGLPDTAVKEAKDRIPTAIRSSGFHSKREYAVTVNLSPPDLRKSGALYDLPIAIALLKTMGLVRNEHLEDYGFFGYLKLSGEVCSPKGIISFVTEMKRIGRKIAIVPTDTIDLSSAIAGIDVIPVRTLREAVMYLNGEIDIKPVYNNLANELAQNVDIGDDFADVKGQSMTIRAMEVAVAGGHNVLMIGTPGSGKTMIARRIPSILPPLTVDEALEVARIHCVSGLEKAAENSFFQRPFRAPHHLVSSYGLVGGGNNITPGEVSLAHRGVLFLDEFPEFSHQCMEALRQPMEDGDVVISRVNGVHRYPAKFMLVAAMNPCPCGYYGDEHRDCRCTQSRILKYQSRISGPILDRIDLQVAVAPVPPEDLRSAPCGESSATIRARVMKAREIQKQRYAGKNGIWTNAEAKSRDLHKICNFDDAADRRLKAIIRDLDLSARAYDRILRVARTIADLEGCDRVLDEHVHEAASYRQLDGQGNRFWA